MDITWLGHSCFRIKGKEVVIVTDPYGPELGYTLGKLSAGIVTVSHPHPGHDAHAAVAGNPKVIAGPGEYDVAGVFVIGLATYHDADKGSQRGKNTVYLIDIDELRLCHLGDLGHSLSPEQAEALSSPDVLMLPVGGVSTIDAARAAETVRMLEPKLVIPMHYKTEALRPFDQLRAAQAQDSALSQDLAPVDRFVREMGLKEAAPQPKLTVTRSNVPSDMRVVVLDYRR